MVSTTGPPGQRALSRRPSSSVKRDRSDRGSRRCVLRPGPWSQLFQARKRRRYGRLAPSHRGRHERAAVARTNVIPYVARRVDLSRETCPERGLDSTVNPPPKASIRSARPVSRLRAKVGAPVRRPESRREHAVRRTTRSDDDAAACFDTSASASAIGVHSDLDRGRKRPRAQPAGPHRLRSASAWSATASPFGKLRGCSPRATRRVRPSFARERCRRAALR